MLGSVLEQEEQIRAARHRRCKAEHVSSLVVVLLFRVSPMQLRNQFGNYAGGLEHALALATLAHANHRELAGTSHALYPTPTALALSDADADARTVALLHDVIAETDLTVEDLRAEGFPEHILDAVDRWSSRHTARPGVEDAERLARYHVALRILDGHEQ